MDKEESKNQSKHKTTTTTKPQTKLQHTKTTTPTSNSEEIPNSSEANSKPIQHHEINRLGRVKNNSTPNNDVIKNGDDRESEDSPLANSALADDNTKDTEEEDENGEKADAKSPDGFRSGVPVDHGWAWVIMGGQFVVILLMVGYMRSLSIFFLEFLELFEVPVSSATIAFGVMTVAAGIGNLLVSHLVISRFSIRRVMLTGALINATCVALTSLAPNMIFVTVMHGVIGLSHALLFIPGTTLLGHYFDKRRSFAMAVANTGFSVSNLIFPPLTQYLITSYGPRGALLLIGGVELQCAIAVCLMRPVSCYTKVSQGGTRRSSSKKDLLDESDVSVSPNRINADGRGREEEDTITRLLDEAELKDAKMATSAQPLPTPSSRILFPPLSSSLPEKSLLSNQSEQFSASEEVLHLSKPRTIMAKKTSYSRQQSCPLENHYHHHILANGEERKLSGSRRSVSALATSIVDIYGSAMNVATDALFLSSSRKGQEEFGADDTPKTRGGCCKRFTSVLLEIINVSLFKNWLFLLIAVYVPLGFSAGFIAFYFAGLAVENNVSQSDAALLLPVLGGVDLVSRLCVGYLADLQLVKRTHLVIVCMTIMGLASQFCKWYTSYGWLALFGVTYGLVGGVCNNLFAVVIIDLLGLELLGKVMGLVLLVNCVFASVNHVLIGALVDTTGSFVIPYHYIGGSLLLSSLVLLMEPLARRLETKRLRKLVNDSDSAREPVKA